MSDAAGGSGAAPDLAVRTEALVRDYGGGAGVFGVDLRVPRGVVYGLVGPNGAGKTTLLSIVTGLRRADSGAIQLAAPPERVAVCPDVPEFEPWLTAAEVVALAGRLTRPETTARNVDAALATVGLAERAQVRVGGFSRGMSQRLGIAAALVGEPELLILDEPTAGLDPAGRSDLLDLIVGMRDRATVILSSHILDDVQRVCDVVGVLRAGRLIYQGPTVDLMDRHTQPAWRVRVDGPADGLAASLAAEPWVATVTVESHGVLLVAGTDLAAGRRRIPALVAAAGLGLISLSPQEADLEAAFLSLVAAREP